MVVTVNRQPFIIIVGPENECGECEIMVQVSPISPLVAANRTRRLVIGFLILIFVNFLWVASAELTRYIFNEEDFHRPYFTSYVKTCMFTIYLLGFMFHRPWRDQCLHMENGYEIAPTLDATQMVEMAQIKENVLSEPQFEPIHSCSELESDARSSSICSSDNEQLLKEDENPPDPIPSRSVRFARIHEVRKLPEAEAHAASLSRLPYEMWLRAERLLNHFNNKLSIRKVAKLSLQFCFLWFLASFSYQAALNFTDAGIVNVLSTSSSLFTLILAALFPSCTNDRFTLSKLCLVLVSMSGVVVVTWVDENSFELGTIPSGAIWALVGAGGYAAYLVFLRKRVDSEEKLDIPMFFGFVGLFCTVLLWPGLYILHATNMEPFYPLPNRTQLMYVAINGLIGTVLSEYLWLWGCFLTSSLIATMSLSLTIPMTVIADNILWKKPYPWEFFLGMTPIIAGFIGAAFLAHLENADPIYWLLRRACHKLLYLPFLLFDFCPRRTPTASRLRDMDREQGESLIAED